MPQKKSKILYKKFGKQKRWVSWKFKVKKKKDGSEDLTKVPMQINGHEAKSDDPSTWVTYAEVKNVTENIGIMATHDKLTLLVDFDNCLDPETGEFIGSQIANIKKFLKSANTYTELSPRKGGIHAILELTAPLDLLRKRYEFNEKEKIEQYTTHRYFTVTEIPFGKEREVRTVTPEEAVALLEIMGYPWGKENKEATEEEQASLPINLTEQEILNKMFSSKNGEEIKRLYAGDTSAYQKDDSRADMALVYHLAFWTRKNPALMEKMWMSSPLGRRKKTLTRTDYRRRTIEAAITNCKEVYDPEKSSSVPMEVVDGKPMPTKIEFLMEKHGKEMVPSLNTENIRRILQQHEAFKGTIRYESFEIRVEIYHEGKWRNYEDADVTRIQCQIQILFPIFRKVTEAMVRSAFLLAAYDNKYDSAQTFIRSLVWDKVPRLDSWLTNVYGVPNDAYHRAVGSNWMKGLASRLMYEHSKFDYVLVIEGAQGTRKSTSLAVLGGRLHLETTMSTEGKDFFMQFAGKGIIEFSEGETLSRTEVKRMKAVITMEYDKYRLPWGKSSQEFPRRCVFAMTTNESEYLKDDTGNRRWLPVALVFPTANIEWLQENRLQLFAEAAYRVDVLKERTYEFPREETIAAQQKRKIEDPNVGVVVKWYWSTELGESGRRNGVSVEQVFKVINGGIINRKISRGDSLEITNILRDTLLLERKQVMVGGTRLYKWYWPDNKPMPEIPELTPFEQLNESPYL